ncbi:MAG: hypothetical protein KAT00_10355, partial [Planctomycetes bacterium]|nr:hypothetical protein [Planctomycetota bacterium]
PTATANMKEMIGFGSIVTSSLLILFLPCFALVQYIKRLSIRQYRQDSSFERVKEPFTENAYAESDFAKPLLQLIFRYFGGDGLVASSKILAE